MSHLCKRQLGETVTSESGGQEASSDRFYITSTLDGTRSLFFFNIRQESSSLKCSAQWKSVWKVLVHKNRDSCVGREERISSVTDRNCEQKLFLGLFDCITAGQKWSEATIIAHMLPVVSAQCPGEWIIWICNLFEAVFFLKKNKQKKRISERAVSTCSTETVESY